MSADTPESLQPPPSADPEVAALEALAERLQGFGADTHAELIDGFLTALAAGPVLPGIGEWLPLLFDDSFERAFADPEDLAGAERTLLARLATVRRHLDAEALIDQPDRLRLEPLLYDWDGAPEDSVEALPEEDRLFARALAQGGALWAEGFMVAVDGLPEVWRRPDDADAAELLDELLGAVGALLQPTVEETAAIAAPDADAAQPTPREATIDDALFAVQDLRVFWLDHAPKPEPRRVEPQPGRNDPCPCGSGKKFKKCHGAAA